jgi:hypothetical protein
MMSKRSTATGTATLLLFWLLGDKWRRRARPVRLANGTPLPAIYATDELRFQVADQQERDLGQRSSVLVSGIRMECPVSAEAAPTPP